MFRILCKKGAPRLPPHPWSHTQEELDHIFAALQSDVKLEPKSVELECPHIVHTHKLYGRISLGLRLPISHPETDMTRANIIARAKEK